MILEKIEKKEDFTNADEIIAQFILEHPFQIENLTAAELGKISYTSKASVFRFCKKIGIGSYDDLKKQIAYEVIEKSRLNKILKQEPFNNQSSLKDIVNILPSFYDSAIHNTILTLDYDVIKRIIDRLNQADRIDIYGLGITASCAQGAVFKFSSIGINCAHCTAINEHYIMAKRKEKIVSVLLSFTGGNPGLMNIASYLKGLGFYVVGIGGSAKHGLKDLCDDYIEIYQKNLVLSFEVMTPYIAITYVLDVLFASLLVKKYEKNLKSSMDVLKYKALIK